jgi:hypothetical protein
MDYNQYFEIHGEEDANIVVNMLNLSQGYYYPLGDDDEYVSATHEDYSTIQENIEVVVSHEPNMNSTNSNKNGTTKLLKVVNQWQTSMRN